MTRLLTLLSLISLASSLPAIHVTGNKFFDSDGNRFYIKGVDYQPRGPTTIGDPIADTAGLTRDIPYLRELGVNVIRVYSADITLNHDEGMKLLENAGIYLLLDATSPRVSISAASPEWNSDIFSGIQAKIAEFVGYSNLFGFMSGNEVLNTIADTIAAPYVKASVRDVKAYIKSLGSTALVGYAATDNPSNDDLQPYLDCLSLNSSIDFYGINSYRWCSGNNFQTSAYGIYTAKPYDAPLIFSEFGCNQVLPRTFEEVQAIFGQMNDVMSGGFVYEYSQEDNNFGLVSISNNIVTTTTDYNNLKQQYASANPAPLKESAYTPPAKNLVSCPSKSSKFLATPSPLPPSPSDSSCTCMYDSLTCVVKSSASVSDIQSAVSTACGSADCSEISTDSTTASYGQWSACSGLQRASFALNQYYQKYSSQGSQACNFGGVGQTQTPKTCSKIAQTTFSVSASQTVIQVVNETQILTSISPDGQTRSVQVVLTQTHSATATAQVEGDNSKAAYQTAWDAAFSSGNLVLPAVFTIVAAALLM